MGHLVAEGTPTDIKGRFSNIRVIEVTVREPRDGPQQRLTELAAVSRVEVRADGLFQQLALHVAPEADISAEVTSLAGEDNVETISSREAHSRGGIRQHPPVIAHGADHWLLSGGLNSGRGERTRDSARSGGNESGATGVPNTIDDERRMTR